VNLPTLHSFFHRCEYRALCSGCGKKHDCGEQAPFLAIRAIEYTQEIALARREGRLPGEVSSTVQDALLFSFCAKHWRVVAS
jgi:hypothetical protein